MTYHKILSYVLLPIRILGSTWLLWQLYNYTDTLYIKNTVSCVCAISAIAFEVLAMIFLIKLKKHSLLMVNLAFGFDMLSSIVYYHFFIKPTLNIQAQAVDIYLESNNTVSSYYFGLFFGCIVMIIINTIYLSNRKDKFVN